VLVCFPLSVWVCYAVLKTRALSAGALAVSIGSGVIAHVLLMVGHFLPKLTSLGPENILFVDIVMM
jgi:hypothetical protein